MAKTRKSASKSKGRKSLGHSRRSVTRNSIMQNVLYRDRLKSHRMELSKLKSAFNADPDDMDTGVAVFVVAQQLVELFSSNQTMRKAVEDDYPDLLDGDEAAEHPVEIIEAAQSFLVDVKNALMRNARGPLYAAEIILYNRLPDALDYKSRPVRDELAELFAQMSVAAPKTAAERANNELANMMGRITVARR